MKWNWVGYLAIAALLAGCVEDSGEPKVGSNNVASNNSTSGNNGTSNNSTTGNNGTTGNNANNSNNSAADCVPSRMAFEENALPFIEEGCTNCHGEEPAFGAPVSLLDYDALIAGVEGERLVDKMADRLIARTMPPPTSPELSHQALDTLVEWATCGAEHPDHSDGLQASRPVWDAPDTAPDLPSFDVTANEYEVSPTTLDRYQCFVVEAPIDEARFIRRIEPVIDDSRVLHHALVRIDRDGGNAGASFGCSGFPPGDEYVYVWAPGQEPLEFPDGGLRIEPGQTFVLQIHYNNGAGAEDVADSSGFRVYHAPTEGTEYGLGFIGSFPSGPISPGETRETSTTCTVRDDVDLVATWPHMHEIGESFSKTITRQDGTTESVLELTGWSFEAQLLYETRHSLRAGDQITMTCRWENYKDFPVFAGEGTEDEMCFDFVYYTPPITSFCN